MNFAELLEELMRRYNEAREAWIILHGTDEGFDVWFTEQVK